MWTCPLTGEESAWSLPLQLGCLCSQKFSRNSNSFQSFFIAFFIASLSVCFWFYASLLFELLLHWLFSLAVKDVGCKGALCNNVFQKTPKSTMLPQKGNTCYCGGRAWELWGFVVVLFCYGVFVWVFDVLFVLFLLVGLSVWFFVCFWVGGGCLFLFSYFKKSITAAIRSHEVFQTFPPPLGMILYLWD